MKIDIFEVLNQDKNSDLESLKCKCQKLLKEFHPDKNGGAESDEFLKVMKVWKILNDDRQFQEAKSLKLAKNKANWDTLYLSDMQEEGENYVKNCRCGDCYILPKTEISIDESEYCLECDSCSNTITVYSK